MGEASACIICGLPHTEAASTQGLEVADSFLSGGLFLVCCFTKESYLVGKPLKFKRTNRGAKVVPDAYHTGEKAGKYGGMRGFSQPSRGKKRNARSAVQSQAAWSEGHGVLFRDSLSSVHELANLQGR
jgi:hypothetical protein